MSAPTPARAAPLASKAEVSDWVVALYKAEVKQGIHPVWVKHPTRVFDQALSAAIQEDVRLTSDDLGALFYDPMCTCQDPSTMKWTLIDVTPTGAATARVRMHVDNADPPENQPTLLMVKTTAGWRIHDVSTHDRPSLLDHIRAENAERRRR